jgi:methionine-rich copper-binding protein CopC
MKRILTAAATLSLSVAAIIGVSGPALAHSELIETSPAAGATVDAGRIPITLIFGEELLTGDDSIAHQVVITNEAGERVPALCASADGFELSTAAAIDQPGKYTVAWRTVSADGHPVDGTFEFKVVNNTDYDAGADPVNACTEATASEGMVVATPLAVDTPLMARDAQSSDSVPGALFIGTGFVVVVVVIAIATRKTLKARKTPKDRVQRRKNKSE